MPQERKLILEGRVSFERLPGLLNLTFTEGLDNARIESLKIVHSPPPTFYDLNIAIGNDETHNLVREAYLRAGYPIPAWIEILDKVIEEDYYPLSTRALKALAGSGVRTLGDLARCPAWEFRGMNNVGSTTVNEIISFAHKYGLSLGSQKLSDTSIAK